MKRFRYHAIDPGGHTVDRIGEDGKIWEPMGIGVTVAQRILIPSVQVQILDPQFTITVRQPPGRFDRAVSFCLEHSGQWA